MGGSLDIIVHAKPEIGRKPLQVLEAEFLECIGRFEKQSKGGK